MQKREIWKVILFGFITFGIYDIYWLITTRREMVQKGETIPSVWLVFAPLLGLLLSALLQIVTRIIFTDTTTNGIASSGTVNTINILSLLLSLIAIIASIPLWIYWTYKYSKAVEHVTNGQTSFNTAFWLALVLGFFGVSFIWPGLIQDGFNKVSENGTPPSTPAPYEPPYPPIT